MNVIYYFGLKSETVEAKVKDIVNKTPSSKCLDNNNNCSEMKPVKPIDKSIYYYQSPEKSIAVNDNAVSDSFRAFVGEVFTPNNFYLVRENDKDKYDELTNQMAQFYGKSLFNYKVDDHLNNQLYATYLPFTDSIARVQLLYSNPINTVAFFIDYGLIYDILTKDIYQLMEQFQELPPRSFKATLFAYEKDFWPADETAHFKQMVSEKVLQVTVNEINGDIYKCTLQTDNGLVNINNELMKLIQF